MSVTAQTVHLNARTRKTVKITDGGPDVPEDRKRGGAETVMGTGPLHFNRLW